MIHLNKNLYTEYGENLNVSQILSEYPRPQFARESFLNLNGYWNYKISKLPEIPESYENRILVPFPIESALSGVQKLLNKEYLIYHRCFRLPENFNRGKVFLNFGAVDQEATVYVNGQNLFHHQGGYFPFSVDITEFLRENNELVVIVSDPTDTTYRAYGKQTLNPRTIWYTPITGIWQTVWLESVPENHLKKIIINPDYDEGEVNFQFETSGPCYGLLSITDKGKLIIQKNFTESNVNIKISDFIPWSPENPHLYDLRIEIGEDVVNSYFAFRKFSIGEGPNGKCLFLNNQPYFMNGVLDQGYYSDGLYTPASDQAFIDDIMKMKDLGFNTLRKHIKIEPLRFYYHCDRLGMIVWQDMVNGGRYSFWKMSVLPTIGFQRFSDIKNLRSFGRETPESQEAFRKELEETVDLLYNVPSIALWTIFNEGWGQFHSVELYHYLKSLDQSRIIDSTSGWFDQGGSDLTSKHIYFKKLRFKKEKRPIVLSEFGGYSCHIKEHSYSKKEYGYKKFSSREDFEEAYISLFENQVIPNLKKGLCACIYTQLSDVEEETNGILTYDRKVCKLNPERIKKLNQKFNL